MLPMQCLLLWLETQLQHLPVPVQCLLLLLLQRRSTTSHLRQSVPVTQASTPGGSANARSFALATAITRESSLMISGQVVRYRLIVSGPMANACVSAAVTGFYKMIPRPYGVVQRRGPGRYTNTGHRNEDLILAEIRSTTSPEFWPRSVRDFFLLRVGDRALASRIQALLLQAAGRAMCADAFYISDPSLHLSFVCTHCVQTPALRCKKRTCECCARGTGIST